MRQIIVVALYCALPTIVVASVSDSGDERPEIPNDAGLVRIPSHDSLINFLPDSDDEDFKSQRTNAHSSGPQKGAVTDLRQDDGLKMRATITGVAHLKAPRPRIDDDDLNTPVRPKSAEFMLKCAGRPSTPLEDGSIEFSGLSFNLKSEKDLLERKGRALTPYPGPYPGEENKTVCLALDKS